MMRVNLKNSLKTGETFVFNIELSYNINYRMSVGGRERPFKTHQSLLNQREVLGGAV